ncbi:MAG: hypothetical protein PUK09_05670 [Bacilli bacterium]|jgi:hypothetical protein|nr:hypothetical protein [Bacilli bacterium]
MARRKQRVGEMFIVFYDNDKLILDKIDELVELTGVKKRDIVIKALKQYLKIDTSKGMDK